MTLRNSDYSSQECWVVVSDNSPFGTAELKDFTERWEFRHTTSSPRFPQSNGRTENAAKTAKRLMMKATESGGEPVLALRDRRNMHLGVLPGKDGVVSLALLRFEFALLAQCICLLHGIGYRRHRGGVKGRPTLPSGGSVQLL